MLRSGAIFGGFPPFFSSSCVLCGASYYSRFIIPSPQMVVIFSRSSLGGMVFNVLFFFFFFFTSFMVRVERSESCTRGFSVLWRGCFLYPFVCIEPGVWLFLVLFLFLFYLILGTLFGVCWFEIVCDDSGCELLIAPARFDPDTIRYISFQFFLSFQSLCVVVQCAYLRMFVPNRVLFVYYLSVLYIDMRRDSGMASIF